MKVLLTDNVDRAAADILAESGVEADFCPTLPPEELMEKLVGYDAVIVRSATKLTADIIGAAAGLSAIGRAGVGVDNIDLPAAKERGIAVFNSPSGNVNAVAEHTVGLMLSLARNIHLAHGHVKAGGWDKKRFKGVELRGKTLGIVGLGKIGRLVASAANGLGMEVVGYDPFVTADQGAAAGVAMTGLDGLLQSSDFITVHVNLTDDTRGLISAREFSMMKDGVRILNVARGGIIDEAALCAAIRSGKVAGAAIDVWENEPPSESELLGLDCVLASPHLGGSTAESQKNVAVDVARNISMFLRDGKSEPQCRVA